MGILTDEMKRAVTELQLCYAATVTPDGKPNLSPTHCDFRFKERK